MFERRTTLLRRAAGTLAEPQVVAVNVDVFFVVTAVNRDFNERRLERYVAAVWNSGAEPVIVLNKVDLDADLAPMLEAIEPRGDRRARRARERGIGRGTRRAARLHRRAARRSGSSARRASASRR